MVVVMTESPKEAVDCVSLHRIDLAVTRVGLDLGKKVFQVHAVDAKGEVVVGRKLTRGRLVAFFAELAPCVVAMKACSSAHHWGRQLLGARARGEADPAGACEARCPAQQERRGRRGGDLRGDIAIRKRIAFRDPMSAGPEVRVGERN